MDLLFIPKAETAANTFALPTQRACSSRTAPIIQIILQHLQPSSLKLHFFQITAQARQWQGILPPLTRLALLREAYKSALV